MARLAAREKQLFYPTKQAIVEAISSNIVPGGAGSILDPCCGTGEPLALLGRKLGLTTYGNELHPERFAQACQQLDYCLNGAREYLVVKGQFNCLFNNCPYDETLEGYRLERIHIQSDLKLLQPDGLGIWIIPEHALDHALCQLLVSWLSLVEIRRFPEPDYKRFRQVVIFGLKRDRQLDYVYSKALELEDRIKRGLPVLRPKEFAYTYKVTENKITQFELRFPELATAARDLETHGVQTSPTWQTLMVSGASGAGMGRFQPLLPLSAGHMAFVLAAGLVDGIQVQIDGQPYVLKGHTNKRIVKSSETEEADDSSVIVVREKERLVQTIVGLGLEDGRLFAYNTMDHRGEFANFLLAHQDLLVGAIREMYPPLFDPERDMAAWLPRLSRIQAPGLLPGRCERGLLPAQQVCVAALATLLRRGRSAILDGEMGSGKTTIAEGVMALLGQGNWKGVVVCPPQVQNKWKRESETCLQAFGLKAHLIGEKRLQPDGTGRLVKVSKPVRDVMTALAEENPSLMIVGYEVAKSGARWTHAATPQRKLIKYPQQVEEIEILDAYPYQRVRKVEKIVSKIERVLCCPDCGAICHNEFGLLTGVEELGSRKRRCSNCGAALWRQIPFAYGGRVAIADFLNRRYSGDYYLIVDEVHRTKGADTDAGYASMDLIAGAKKVLAMTGTIYSGKSSSIFPLLYRLDPAFRQLYEYDQVDLFVAHHGLSETITTFRKDKKKEGYHSAYGYVRESVRTREIPGVSPGIVTMLLHKTAFIKLTDLGSMPPYTELRLPVPLDKRLEEGIKALTKIYDDAAKRARKGNPGLLSAWTQATLGWLDCPVDEILIDRDDKGEILKSYLIPGVLSRSDTLPGEPLAKDQALLNLIESELAQHRGCGVYFSQVNRRDWMPRLQKLLQRQGIYSEVLRQHTCKPHEREAWYQGFVQRCRSKGQEPLLLTNGNLVKEGLDLIELPTLIETGIEYRINDLRQRDRRSWRLMQDRPVKVVFVYYENSWQQLALQLVAAKLKAALLVDGSLIEGLAAMDADSDSLMEILMKEMTRLEAGEARLDLGWSGMEIARVEPLISLNPV